MNEWVWSVGRMTLAWKTKALADKPTPVAFCPQ